jgi:hypothetical protein
MRVFSINERNLTLRTELEHKRNAARTTVRLNAPRLPDRRPLQGRESGKGGISVAKQRVTRRAFVTFVGAASVLATSAVLGAAQGDKRLSARRRVP